VPVGFGGKGRRTLQAFTSLLRELHVRLPGRHGTTAEGAVVDLRSGVGSPTVVAEFPPPGTPLLPMGQNVPLEFSGGSLSTPMVVEGRTVLWSTSSTAFTYDFEVTSAAITALIGTGDRRDTRRVMPAGSRQEVALARPGGAPVVGVLQDLSVGGVGVHVSMEGEARLLGAYELQVKLALDGFAEPLELPGFVRSRVLTGALVRYGIQFDAQRLSERAVAVLKRVVAAA
jgi:hypothetical protein